MTRFLTPWTGFRALAPWDIRTPRLFDRFRHEMDQMFGQFLAAEDDERQLIVEFFKVQLARLAAGELDARAITGRTDAELNDALRAQAAWTLTARAVLNLDEVITKE